MMKAKLQNDVLTSDKKVMSRNQEKKVLLIVDSNGNTNNVVA